MTAQSIVERHDLAIQFDQDLHRHTALDGRNYTMYELGSIIPLVPFYWLGTVVAQFFSFPDPNWVPLLFTGLLNPVLTALTCVLFYKLGIALGNSPSSAGATALLFGLATIAWPYSKALEREALLALFLILPVYASIRFRQSGETKWLWVAGVSLGYLCFAKIANVVVLPIFVLYLVADVFPTTATRLTSQLFRRLVYLGIPIALLVGTQALYNWIRYGDFTDIGLVGLWGNPIHLFSLAYLPQTLPVLLFSPTKSIFIYSPPLLLFFPGMVAFFRQSRRDALLVGSLIATGFLFYAFLYTDGGIWWGPKYVVAMTPLALVPIGALLTGTKNLWKRFWYALASVIGLFGLGVQVAAALVDEREYADVMGEGVDLAGAADFARHGAIDSLIVYLSPVGQFIQANVFGIVVFLLAMLFAAWIVWRICKETGAECASSPWSLALLVLVILVQFAAFLAWVVAPYPQVLAAQADTKFVSGNLFLADQRLCEAKAMYLMSLDQNTQHERLAVARLEALLPRARGALIGADDLMDQLETTGSVTVEKDSEIALSEEGALKITLRAGQSASAAAMSDFVPARPNQTYELSGWMKSASVTGSGYAAVTIYEDAGDWRKGRGTDVKNITGTHGWHPFWGKITTLPTTQRFLIKVALGQVQGTVWVDRLQLAEITDDNPESQTTKPCRAD